MTNDFFPSTLNRAGGPGFDLVYQGVNFVDMTLGSLRDAGVPEAVLLVLVKGRLKGAVDAKAEALRSSITTPGTGQAMEYQEAQTQAAAALKASASATAEKYPMLAASVGIDFDPQTAAPAADVVGVARAVMAAYEAWQAIGAEIRRVRLSGKAAIDAALTDEEAAVAYAAVTWPALG